MSKDQYQHFKKEFENQNEWQDFMNRISGLLPNAIAEDAANDREAALRYDATGA